MSISDIHRVGVVGSGLMGHGIALAFAMGGYPTLMCDLDNDRLDAAMRNAAATARLFADEGLITPTQAEEALAMRRRILVRHAIFCAHGRFVQAVRALRRSAPDGKRNAPWSFRADGKGRIVLTTVGDCGRTPQPPTSSSNN